MHREGRLFLFLIGRPLCVLLLIGLSGCRSNAKKQGSTVRSVRERVPAQTTEVELTPEFLTRAQSALLERVGSQARLLEMRAEGRSLSYVVLLGGKLKQVDYVEEVPLRSAEGREGALPPTSVGKIYGPDVVPSSGEGPVEENLFDLKDVRLSGIARSFEVALRAVDPEHGTINEVVVRRFLPFSTAVRARIYVKSPKMSGSIDTNERGIPLKKR